MDGREIAFIRAVAAGVAALAVARELLGRARFAASRLAVLTTLVVAAIMAVAAFFNLGRGQFWDHHRHQRGYVHNYDLKIYYPMAKYFGEIGVDGLYLASVAAYVEDVPAATPKSIGHIEIWDRKRTSAP